MNSEEVISQLCDVIGTDSVITDNKEREYFSMDVFDIDEVADLVIQPSSKDQISDALKILSKSDYEIIPRGGGMSYTGGYTPSTKRSAIIDTSLLNQIIEINPDDMYITVEAGCTWKKSMKHSNPWVCDCLFLERIRVLWQLLGAGYPMEHFFWHRQIWICC